MNLGILISDLTASGGAPRQALLLAQWLQAFGHSATVYAVRYSPEKCFPEIAASLHIRAVERVSAAEAARRKSSPHHGLVAGVKRHFWESRQLANLIEPGHDILNPHVRGATRAAVRHKRRAGTPVVWMCDDARNWEEPGYRPHYGAGRQWFFDRVMPRVEKPVVRDIDRIVALDHRVQNILQRYYGRPCEVVRSGLDSISFCKRPEARERIRAKLGIAAGDFVLLWLGIIEPHRRLEDAIEGLSVLRSRGRKNIRLLIAGSPDYALGYVRRLQQLTVRYQLGDQVSFHLKAVPEADMPDYYSAADALVYLAKNQCWGLGVFEALACDLPVIVSRACGVHEVLDDRQTAMLVPPENATDLADKVAYLADSPGLRESLVRQARMQVLDQITWEIYARNMLRVFEQVLAECAQSAEPAREEAFA